MITTGIPQGSPMSPILYLFYNSDFLEGCTNVLTFSSALGYIDDIAIIVTGDSEEANCRIVEVIHETVAVPWAKKHASVFDLAKYVLMYFRREKAAHGSNDEDSESEGESPTPESIDDISVKLSGFTIRPKKRGKYLGVMLDKRLSWVPHIRYIDKKSTAHLGVLGLLASFTWGVSLDEMRTVYHSSEGALLCLYVVHTKWRV